MNTKLRLVLAMGAVTAFCAGPMVGLHWFALLLIKLVPVLLALDWLRAAGTPGPYRRWIALGLALSLLGDLLLALPQDRFVAGLIAFLCAHLAYVMAYLHRSRAGSGLWLLCALLLVSGFLYLLDSRADLGLMRGPVYAYAIVIGAMLWRSGSLSRLDRSGRWALLGATLFVASDMLLAWNRFVAPDALRGTLSILLYWAGQWGIAASAIRLRAGHAGA